MQRTFVTEVPETLNPYQVVVDLPRYEFALAKALYRGDATKANRFLTDDDPINILTTNSTAKMFVDALGTLDAEMLDNVRIPYGTFAGVNFKSSGEAVRWARKFVQKYFPATEERLLRRALLTLPLDKSEIVWVGGDKYLNFVQAVATSPSTDELVRANSPSSPQVPLTREEASKKRAEIAAKRGKKDNEAQTASDSAN